MVNVYVIGNGQALIHDTLTVDDIQIGLLQIIVINIVIMPDIAEMMNVC